MAKKKATSSVSSSAKKKDQTKDKKAAATKSAAPKPAIKKAAAKSSTKTGDKKNTKKAEHKTVVAELVDDNDTTGTSHFESAETEKAYAVPKDDSFTDDDIPFAKAMVPAEVQKSLTSTDPLAMYLNEIRRYKLLTREEELALAKKYFETKDPNAAQDLVKANLRFVVKVASDYSKFGAKMIDLIQEGNVGLMHAVREYNPYKGARLITYAVWWIRGYIQEYLMRQYSLVRIGTTQNQRKLFYQLQKEKEALDAMGIEPNAALIGSRLGIPENEVQDMTQRMSGRDLSLDKPMDGESGVSLGDLQKDGQDVALDERMARAEQLEILKEKLDEIRPELSDREKIILDERILNDEPLTLQEIGEKYGITREAVRQMEVRVMKKIKAKMDIDGE